MTICPLGKNYQVYFDIFFTNVKLVRDLQVDRIYSCGTVRLNRKLLTTDIKKDKQLAAGETDWRHSKERVLFLMWKGKKGITFLSNIKIKMDRLAQYLAQF